LFRGCEIKEDEMDKTCSSTSESDEECIGILVRKSERQRPLVRLWCVTEHVVKIGKGTEYEDTNGKQLA
jgi:hypothetical protein